MENSELQHEHPLEQQEEDDESEEISLVATRRKNLNQTTINGDYTINNVDSVGATINGKGHHHQQQQQQDEDKDEEEVKDFVQQNDIRVDEDKKEKEKPQEFCVYYDKDKGTGTIDELDNTDITINNQQNGNGMHSDISKQNGEHQKHEIISSEGDKSALSYINNKTETNDIEVIKDGDNEITEHDVETVLKKQDTHDLFCPNCNSCITKRVILRKRKRRIPVPGEDGKRSKPQAPVSAESIVIDDSSDNQALNGVDLTLDEFQVQPPSSNEYDHQREPDVFRCLSCFSIFMPTGNGFKFIRMFGNKRSEENNELSQKEVAVKKNWFSKCFGSDKVELNVTDLNDSGAVQSLEAENNVVGVSSVSSNLNSSMQEGKMATDSTLADTNKQLLTSYHTEKESSSKSEYPGMFVVKPPSNNSVEPTENPISPLQHDGLKLLIPQNVGSLIIDNSQMNQELDITVQTISPVSVQSTDAMAVVSQDTVQNNVEIHLEEPLKVNKDILTDSQQVNLLTDAKNIERIEGNNTIITIESKQLDASTFQRLPDPLGATGTPALQQAVEQGRVNTVTGGGPSMDVIKSIVYGGLIELIASLSVVASAAGGDATTLNVLALALANIFGGLFVISHDLWDLKSERTRKTEDRYQRLLGQRADFPLHMVVSLLSYLVFGFLPPLVYGFSFHVSNDKDLKLLTVAAASLVCIMILSAGKAYVQSPPKSYFKTIGYHVVLGFMVSGVSYVFGGLFVKLLEKMDMFPDGSVDNLRIHGASSKSALATF